MPTAMQMLNETYIAPSTCAMKTAVTRHHRCGGMVSEEGHFSLACHDGPERQQHAARHDQVQHAQREEYALAGDALKLAPHDEAEGDEKNSGQNIYGTFFHLHPS